MWNTLLRDDILDWLAFFVVVYVNFARIAGGSFLVTSRSSLAPDKTADTDGSYWSRPTGRKLTNINDRMPL